MAKARVEPSLSDPQSRALSTFHAASSNSDFQPFRYIIQGESLHLSVLICKMEMIMLTWQRCSDVSYVFYSSRLCLLGPVPPPLCGSRQWPIYRSPSPPPQREALDPKHSVGLFHSPGHSIPSECKLPKQGSSLGEDCCCEREGPCPSESLIWSWT